METLTDWITLISGEERRYKQGDMVVNVYGELDDSYVVIEKNKLDNPKTVDQFIIHPNHANKLFGLLGFLSEFDFNLLKLMATIESSEFTHEDFNDILILGSVEIAKYEIVEN